MLQTIQEDSDTGAIVLCAIRYCFGRQTYMPSLVVEWVKRHWGSLKEKDRALILRDVEQAVPECKEGRRSLGADIDVGTWQRFLEWLQQQSEVKA